MKLDGAAADNTGVLDRRGPGARPELASVSRHSSRGSRRRSGAAGSVERNAERRLEDRHPRTFVELSGRVGRSCVRHHRRRRQGRDAGAQTRADLHGAIPRRHDVRRRHRHHRQRAPLAALRRGRPHRQDPMGTDHRRGHPLAVGPPEEHVCVADAGDRRRAHLRLSRVRGALRVRHGRQAGLVQADGRPEDANGLGLGQLARSAQRAPLHRQRQRRGIVRRGVRGPHGNRALARGAGRGVELDDAVSSGSTSAAPRSSRPAPGRCARTTPAASCCGS